MAYSQVTTRTTSDANAAADVNQLQVNIEALKGGTGSVAPTTNIEALALIAGKLTGTVDGVSKSLKWKTLTGTTTGTDAVPHGLDQTKILFYVFRCYDNLGNARSPVSYESGNYLNGYDNATNINIESGGVFVGQTYILTIFYYE